MNTSEFKRLLKNCVRHVQTDSTGAICIDWRQDNSLESELVARGRFTTSSGIVVTALDYTRRAGEYFRVSNSSSRDFMGLGGMSRPLQPAR